MLSERSSLLSEYINSNTIDSLKINYNINNTAASSLQATALTITPTSTAAVAAAYLYLEKVKLERMSPRVTAAQIDSLKDAIMESSAAAAVAAAMVNNNNIYVKTNNNNNTNSNNNNKSSVTGTASNCSYSCSSLPNNLVNSQVQHQIAKNSMNNINDELSSHSPTQSCNQAQQQKHPPPKLSHNFHHQQQQQLSLHMNINHVKRERLSPGTNGDLQASLSRSRSTTPSSFRGTPPQNSIHSSPSDTSVPMHNLSTNLLNSIHQATASCPHGNLSASSSVVTTASSGLPADFSTRNYSDFMRSLAAKYNNTNPNDKLKRIAFFEATPNNTSVQKKTSASSQKPSYATASLTPLQKDVTVTTTSSLPPPALLTSAAISPSESTIKLSQPNKLATAVANAAASCSSNVSPYMTSFLSSLPFSPGIFPPLIDMSSTQALITLARAAKENEIHNILSVPSAHSKRSGTYASPSNSPSLNMALQQAAQFISPALIYSAQLQKQQLLQQQHHHQQHPSLARQSSPRLVNISISASSSTTSPKSTRNHGEKVNVSPLDLSSQPPAVKRFKAESPSSQSSIDGLMHTATRRTSSSTATTSPSPPPNTEKSLNASSITVPVLAVTPSSVVRSSSQTEATLPAFTPIKIASSTSAPSSIPPAVTVLQCQAHSEELNSWTVDDVCAFVSSIDICAEYVKHFRDQCIDGSGLPLLTEDHLVNSLGMKLGPALKLRSVLAKKLGGPCPCVTCVAQVQQVLALQTSGMTATAATTTDRATASNTTNFSAFGNNTKSSGSYNIQIPKNSLSSNSITSNNNQCNINSPPNKNESTSPICSAISTNNTPTNVCNNEGTTSRTTRSNSNSKTDVGNFSSSPPLPPAATMAQQQQHNFHQQQQSPPPSSNRHDNADTSS